MEVYHNPVLLESCIDALKIVKDGVYVDATFGGGGHSKAILSKLGKSGIKNNKDEQDNNRTKAI